jgi:exodeoxyribonuclease V alpha subunit
MSPHPGWRDPPDWLAPLAAALAEALPRLHGTDSDPRLEELITALSLALERGELELDLAGPAPPGVAAAHWPSAHRRSLAASPLCQEPHGPLALEGSRLLWRRWQRRRQGVIGELLHRAAPPRPPAAAPEPLDLPAGAARLDRHQRRAVAAVLEHGLVLLEGGPGTGKTSTVAAMLEHLAAREPAARVHLAAPTGKAAARLRAACGARWPCTTLHRLLESHGEGFRRDRRRPLALDLLVVDEVSMVDLALMEALLEALPHGCRLVLVGDPAQLPPVAPGSVLAELQRPELRRALGPAAITLQRGYRSSGPLAAAAAGLRRRLEADPAAADDALASILALATEGDAGPLQLLRAAPERPPSELLARLRSHLEELGEMARRCAAQQEHWRPLLRLRDRLLVLAPLRRGPWGVETLHRVLLGEALAGRPEDWPAGLPVLCRRNLPDLGLSNGDVGVLVPAGAAAAEGGPTLLFGDGRDEAPLRVRPAQLAAAVEPALVLTVHKAQGSEAEEVWVVLPFAEDLDPRLLYTALTRARSSARLIVPPGPANET